MNIESIYFINIKDSAVMYHKSFVCDDGVDPDMFSAGISAITMFMKETLRKKGSQKYVEYKMFEKSYIMIEGNETALIIVTDISNNELKAIIDNMLYSYESMAVKKDDDVDNIVINKLILPLLSDTTLVKKSECQVDCDYFNDLDEWYNVYTLTDKIMVHESIEREYALGMIASGIINGSLVFKNISKTRKMSTENIPKWIKAKLPRKDKAMIEMCDGNHTIREIASGLDMDYFTTLKKILSYKGKGIEFVHVLNNG